MFSIHITSKEFENAISLWAKKYSAPLRVRVNHVVMKTSSFPKSFVFKMFSVQANFFKFLGLAVRLQEIWF